MLLVFGCSKKKDSGDIRLSPERHITIINNTGSPIKGYTVSTTSGILVLSGNTSDKSFPIKIPDGFKKDSEFEVALVDVYNIIYVKNFNVPERDNTDVPISSGDRKSEGVLLDRWKDISKWFNETK